MSFVFYFCYAECHYSECHYAEYQSAECRGTVNGSYRTVVDVLFNKPRLKFVVFCVLCQ